MTSLSFAGDRAARSERTPLIIQGGMGAGVSDWRLAKAVSQCGQLGVVSGTALDTILVRRLQDGDAGGHVRRALRHFPLADVSQRVLESWFLEGGRAPDQAYRVVPMHQRTESVARQQLTVLSAFVEVWLAREGHDGLVGINLLTKIQLPNLATLYGAMLAGVDFVLMGAGIPREIPGVLDAFALHQPASMRLDVEGALSGESYQCSFYPEQVMTGRSLDLTRPRFLPIVSANSLAMTLARKSNGKVDGFVVERPTAGGHNAPPRGEMKLDDRGEPIYGERDEVNLEKMCELDLPFWVAGSTGSPGELTRMLDAGAAGIQVGTLFAYCNESGLDASIKTRVLTGVAEHRVHVRTDPRASPTGFPFKIVELDGESLSDPTRDRECDLGYLRVPYRMEGGRLGYRCAAEPVRTYVSKGGKVEDTDGRRCLCNGLLADIGFPQLRAHGAVEPPLVTSGDDLVSMDGFLKGRSRYSAADVVTYLTTAHSASTLPRRVLRHAP